MGFQRRVVFSSTDLNRAQRAARSAAESLFAVLFPSDCRICESPLTEISTLPVCGDCRSRVAPLSGTFCRACGERLASRFTETEDGSLCGLCRRAAPPFVRAVAYGAYDGALRDLIHLLKYQRIHSVAPMLAGLLAEVLAPMRLPDGVAVIPVPLFKGKRRERGFNQAEEIARAFVRRWPDRSIQLESACLVRTRPTASQTGLTRHQRRANLRGAFSVVRPERIRNRSLLLVDDVMTTGTTAGECARVLIKAGAKEVFVATVARAIREIELSPAEEAAWAQSARA